MKTPEQIADEIVDRFSWSTNVCVDGQLVGQQYVVAQAIADAIRAERDRTNAAKATIVTTAIALTGLNSGRLRRRGRVVTNAMDRVETTLSALR